MAETVSNPPERIWFLDRMRYVIVLIVVLFHGVGSQADFFVNAVVHDTRSLAVANWFFFFCITFQMPLLFFVAGYFAIPSLQRKGTGRFVVSKVFRLLIPAAVVFVLLNPIHRYLYHWSRDFEAGLPKMGYLEFLPHFFGGASWFEIKSLLLHEYSILHLWFITVLFTLFVIFALLSVFLPVTRFEELRCSQACTLPLILRQMAVAGVVGLARRSTNPAVPSVFRVDNGRLVPDVRGAFGLLACDLFLPRNHGLPERLVCRAEDARLDLGVADSVAVMAVVMILFDMAIVESEMQLLETYWIALLYWAFTTIACLLFLGSFLAVMRRYCNTTSPVHKYLARTSYRVYLVHYCVVCCVQFAFLQLAGLSPYTVLIGTAIGSVALTFLLVAAVEPLARWYAETTKRMLKRRSPEMLETMPHQAE